VGLVVGGGSGGCNGSTGQRRNSNCPTHHGYGVGDAAVVGGCAVRRWGSGWMDETGGSK
jgi:hypothetical protein